MEAKLNAKAKIKKPEGEVLLGPDGNYYQVNRLTMAKLKDKGGRGGINIDVRKLGYVPDVFVVQKVQGKNNHIVISALVLKGGPDEK